MVSMGGCTPDSKTGRVTVTGLIVDEDNMIPGLTRLAKAITNMELLLCHRFNILVDNVLCLRTAIIYK